MSSVFSIISKVYVGVPKNFKLCFASSAEFYLLFLLLKVYFIFKAEGLILKPRQD